MQLFYEFISFVNMSFNESTKIVKMEMNETERKFSAAALAVFKRFGVRKATMEEIAAEAGVSKPTLYATFRNKDAALGGAIRFAKDAQLQSVLAEWQTAQTLSDKLDILFGQLVLAGFDMLHNAPDAAAFDNAIGDSSNEAIKVTREAETEAVRALFEAAPAPEGLGASPEQFAAFLVDSAMNAKRLAQTREELERHLDTLKAITCVLLETKPPVSEA